MPTAATNLKFHAPLAPARDLAPFPWISLCVAILVLAILLAVLAWGISRWKNRPRPLRVESRSPYEVALDELTQPYSSHNEAAKISSHCLRRYLADKWNDPSLYETHEEFVARHHALTAVSSEFRMDIQQLLQFCAAVKYAAPTTSGGQHFIDQTRELLERLESHATPTV